METEAIPVPIHGRYIPNLMRIAFGSGRSQPGVALLVRLAYLRLGVRRRTASPSRQTACHHLPTVSSIPSSLLLSHRRRQRNHRMFPDELRASRNLDVGSRRFPGPVLLVTETLVCLTCVGVLALVCGKYPAQWLGWLGIVLVTTDTLLFLATISTIWISVWHT